MTSKGVLDSSWSASGASRMALRSPRACQTWASMGTERADTLRGPLRESFSQKRTEGNEKVDPKYMKNDRKAMKHQPKIDQQFTKTVRVLVKSSSLGQLTRGGFG